jgi:hypothetical protein
MGEELIPLGVAANYFPGARGADRVNPATVFRWCVRGTRTADGRLVKLESLRVGCRLLTSRQAVIRYVERLSMSPPRPHQSPGRSPTETTRSSEAAAAELKRMGA